MLFSQQTYIWSQALADLYSRIQIWVEQVFVVFKVSSDSVTQFLPENPSVKLLKIEPDTVSHVEMKGFFLFRACHNLCLFLR